MKFLFSIILLLTIASCAVQPRVTDLSLLTEKIQKTIDSIPVIYFDQGMTAYKEGKVGEAMANFTNALTWKTNFAEALYMRGRLKTELGEIEAGCVDLNRAGELGFTEAYILLKKVRSDNFKSDK